MPLPTAALAAALSSAALAGPAVADAAAADHDPVVDWNRTALSILRTPGEQPATIHPTRSLALLHAAIYDAVVSIDHSAPPYRVSVDAPRRASRAAAADAAAATVLDALFPSMSASTDAQEQSELSALGGGDRVRAGVQAGRAVAERLLALRAGDGSDAKPPAYVTTGLPGDFAPAPPGFAAPVFTHWGAVTPFVLRSGDELRPDAPPAVGSAAYARALREVQSLGSATSTTRTEDQTEIARFWAAPIQNYWNEIAQTAVTATHARLDTSARAFALLDLAQADATIAFYDAKYAYRVWRPVTAIRETSDPGWTPLATTPADPSYPGAHSVVSAASATVLRSLFGDDLPITVTSEVLPGAQRTFPSFSAIVDEAGLSRIYAGVHTRLDHEAGVGLGRDVARAVLRGEDDGGSPRAVEASRPAVAVRRTRLGRLLVDDRGRTLYLFEKDRTAMSTCDGACAAVWPAATVHGRPRAGAGVSAARLGTTRSRGGVRQLTYAGHPLYRFAGDRRAGDTTGEGLRDFGAGWYVVAPSGRKIDRD